MGIVRKPRNMRQQSGSPAVSQHARLLSLAATRKTEPESARLASRWCASCGNTRHEGPYQIEEGLRLLLETAGKTGWQVCKACFRMVERTEYFYYICENCGMIMYKWCSHGMKLVSLYKRARWLEARAMTREGLELDRGVDRFCGASRWILATEKDYKTHTKAFRSRRYRVIRATQRCSISIDTPEPYQNSPCNIRL